MTQRDTVAEPRLDERGSPGFDRMASEYDASRGEYPTEYLLKGLQISLGEEFEQLKGKKVLDAGAGTGQISNALLTAGAHVTGVDISPKMLEIAKDRCKDFENFNPMVGDLCNLEFEDNSFDVITSRWVLEFVPCWTEAIKELRRVLKPGGTMVLVFTNNMLKTTPRNIFEDISRRRGAKIGLPGASNRLLESYLRYQGAEINVITPEELYWDRELPVERTLWEFRSRIINHLYEISDQEYEEILAETEEVLARDYPADLVDRPTVVTSFWHIKFTKEPGMALGAKFKATAAASKLKRGVPRAAHRSLFRLKSTVGMN